MTPQIATVLAIVAAAVVLFATRRLPMEVVALMVLVSLPISGLLTPAEALSGFSNPAVVTVWAVFVLGGGLSRTGVTNLLGRQVLHLAGRGEARLLVVIMLTAGVMSAFMNNVGVAALLLPVVMDIARHTARPPSRLLMPLAFGSLLGGLNTLIGTSSNILVSDALREYGLRPFQLFDYTPVGLPVMLSGVLFMAFIGRYLLPSRDPAQDQLTASNSADLQELYGLQERLFVLSLTEDSTLSGKTLSESRLGAALGLNVVAILRGRQIQTAPGPQAVLQSGDRVLVAGRPDRLTELQDGSHLIVEANGLHIEDLVSIKMAIAEVRLSSQSSLVGQTLAQARLRQRFAVNVLAIEGGNVLWKANLQNTPLQPGDGLLVQGTQSALDELRQVPDFESWRAVPEMELAGLYHLYERLAMLLVPASSVLVGKTLTESHLGHAFGMTVLAIDRAGRLELMPAPEERLQAGDRLLVEVSPDGLLALRDLEHRQVDGDRVDLGKLKPEQAGLSEVVLSPHTRLAGKTLSQLHFREKYGLNVLALWREGRAYRSNLQDMPLHFGDALLLYGPHERLKLLGSEPDFLVLTEEAQEAPRLDRAPFAVLIMVAVLLPVILGWLPLAITAIAGAVLMVLMGCLTIDEVYRYIEWKAVFLIAGMLPLGAAMEQAGAARLVAESVMAMLAEFGPLAVVAGLFMLGMVATQMMPTSAVAVLLAPIALNVASELGISPYSLMMTVAVAVSVSFLSPVTHPANVLVMGPGGYRFTDYIKVGLPLSLVVLVTLLLVLPVFWPL